MSPTGPAALVRDEEPSCGDNGSTAQSYSEIPSTPEPPRLTAPLCPMRGEPLAVIGNAAPALSAGPHAALGAGETGPGLRGQL